MLQCPNSFFFLPAGPFEAQTKWDSTQWEAALTQIWGNSLKTWTSEDTKLSVQPWIGMLEKIGHFRHEVNSIKKDL